MGILTLYLHHMTLYLHHMTLYLHHMTLYLHHNVQVYTVGIGDIYLPELRFIASDPDSEHVFLLNSFNDAQGFVDLLSFTTCDGEPLSLAFSLFNCLYKLFTTVKNALPYIN